MKKKKHKLLIGAHISVAGGLEKSIERGTSIGCTTMQIFTKSNRQWAARPLTSKEIETFKIAAKNSSINPIVAHATYLINLGSPKKDIEKKSIDTVKMELKRCEDLYIPYLILHPGSHLNTSEETCLKQISNNLNNIFKSTESKTMILLETMSGQGTGVCYTFEQIAYLIKHSKYKSRLGVCFDTCHTFVAGYDFRTKKTYEDMWKHFDTTIGLKKLKVIHVNDSKKDIGSRVDRHEHIGKGKIGENAFALLFNDKKFFDIPKILETPKEDLSDDARNIKKIKSLLTKETRKELGTE